MDSSASISEAGIDNSAVYRTKGVAQTYGKSVAIGGSQFAAAEKDLFQAGSAPGEGQLVVNDGISSIDVESKTFDKPKGKVCIELQAVLGKVMKVMRTCNRNTHRPPFLFGLKYGG